MRSGYFLKALLILLSIFIAYLIYPRSSEDSNNGSKDNGSNVANELTALSDSDTIELTAINNSNEEITVSLEVAESDSKKAYGLMNRTQLGEDRGMIFIYDSEANRTFWMKDTLIPLDIIFLNSELEIINIEPAKANQTSERYRSQEPSQYIIEMNRGWAESNNISSGDAFVVNEN